jgi:hypothetical protein
MLQTDARSDEKYSHHESFFSDGKRSIRSSRSGRGGLDEGDINETPALMTSTILQAPSFELDMPEHLPSSPLCPKNPKHRSGGQGICAYHERKRSDSIVF